MSAPNGGYRWISQFSGNPYDPGGPVETLELQRQDNFELHILGLSLESEAEGAKDNNLVFAVETAALPSTSNEEVNVPWGNRVIKVAGKVAFDSQSVNLKDFIGADIEALIWKWRCQVYNPETDQVGWAAEYKKEALLYEFSPEGTIARIWKYVGMWPQQVNFGSLDQSSGDKKMIECTLSYDYAFRYDESRGKMLAPTAR